MNEEYRAVLIEAALQKITADIGFGAPELWETVTKGKVRARLDRLTRLVEGAATVAGALPRQDPRSRKPKKMSKEDIEELRRVLEDPKAEDVHGIAYACGWLLDAMDRAMNGTTESTSEDARIVRQLLSDFVPTTRLRVGLPGRPGVTILGDALERADRLIADRRWGGWKWNETDLSAVAGPYHENEDLLEMLLGPELVNANARVVDDPTGGDPAIPTFFAFGNPCRVVIRRGVETSLDDAIEGARVVFAQQGELFPDVTEAAIREQLEKWGVICLVWTVDPRSES